MEKINCCPPQDRAGPTRSNSTNAGGFVAASPSRDLRDGEGTSHLKLSPHIITIDEPKTYTTHWTFGPKTMKLKPGWEIGELFCTLEDQKNFEKTVMELANKP